MEHYTDLGPLAVMVVEDDPIFMLYYQGFLQQKNVFLRCCTSLSEAREALVGVDTEFDVLIVDNHLVGDELGLDLLPDFIAKNSYAAIIMVSANDDPDFFISAFLAGIHDYMVKPANLDLLWIKVVNSVKKQRLRALSDRQSAALTDWVRTAQHEQNLAKHLFDFMFKDDVHLSALHVWVKPHGVFSGDAVYSVFAPDGSLYTILADAMGHGLAPALSLMPALQIFRGMASKAKPLAAIVAELNDSLHNLLPEDRFVAATLLHVNLSNNEIEVWNCGMPTMRAIGANGLVLHRIHSHELALGVLPSHRLSSIGVRLSLEDVKALLMNSDGLTEVSVSATGPLNEEQLLELVYDVNGFSLASLRGLFAEVSPKDDVSVVLLDVDRFRHELDGSVTPLASSVGGMMLNMAVSGDALKRLDPVGIVIEAMRAQNLPDDLIKRSFTVLTELYANALEHGVLQLNSALKEEEQGFIGYYLEKEQRLTSLTAADQVALDVQWQGEHGRLLIEIFDSGAGYECDGSAENLLLSGRGLHLINRLTNHFQIVRPGNRHVAVLSTSPLESPDAKRDLTDVNGGGSEV